MSGGLESAFRLQTERARSVAQLMRLAYFFPVYWVVARCPELVEALQNPELTPLWPAAWLPFGLGLVHAGLVVSALVVGLVVGAFWGRRWTRMLYAATLGVVLGIVFSYGKVHHLMHGWLWLALLWSFAPEGWDRPDALDRAGRQQMLRLFASCQLAFGATYSLSGISKLMGAGYQAFLGQPHALMWDAFPRHVASRVSQTLEPSPLAAPLIDLGPWSWPIWALVLLVQSFGIVLAVRPHLQRWFGLFLCIFHASSALLLTIDFSPNIMLAAVLLIASPFARSSSLLEAVRDLPGLKRHFACAPGREPRSVRH